MNELLRLLITVGVNNTEAVNALNDTTNQANTSVNKMTGFFKKLGGAVAAYFAFDKIKDFGVKIVQTAANVEAENAQFSASFKEYSDEANKMFERVGNSTGVFASRLKVTGTKAYSQFKGAGLDANKALKNTETFLGLASDAAAYYDISLEDAEARIRSFLRGNVEAGDAIGLFTSESQRNQYAVDMYGKKWIKLSEAQKQNLMLKVAEDIYKQSGAIGQAQRESDGLSNVTGNLKEVWRQFLAVIGKPVLQAVIPIMQTLTTKVTEWKTKVEELKVWIENNGATLELWKQRIIAVTAYVVALVAAWKTGLVVKQVTDAIKLMNVALSQYQLAAQSSTVGTTLLATTLKAKELIWGLLTGKIDLATVKTALFTKAQTLLNTVLNMNPIGLIIIAITSLVAIFAVAYNKSETFRNAVNKLWGVIKDHLLKAFEAIKPALEEVVNAFMELWEVIYTNVKPIFDWFYEKIKQYMPYIKSVISANVTMIVTQIKNAITLIKGAIEVIATVVKTVINNVKIVIQTGFDVIKNIFKVFTSVIKGDWKGAWEAIKNIGKSVMNGLKGIFSNTFSGIKSILSTYLSTIKSVFSNTWNGIKSSTSKVWNGIRDSVTKPVKQAMDKVKSYIDKIRSFFTGFTAKIKMPHFTIKNASLNPKDWIKNGVPKLSVEWYKEGGIMKQPTAFGYNVKTGSVMAGGEAGYEVVAGLDPLMNMINGAVATQNSGLANVTQRIYDILANFLPIIAEGLQVELVLDGDALVGRLIPKIDKQLGSTVSRKARY